jgi:GH24 family phage-related lysozyme (muramidase)
MAYLDSNARSTRPTSNEQLQPLGRIPVLNGVFIGFVKDSVDVQKNGRLRVWIPELGSAPYDEDGWLVVNYCSPFAGATNVDTTSKTDLSVFNGTQTSYGMWMIPPDINNKVIVMFINGDTSKGIWIGCLYDQFMNNMVPGMAADSNNYQYNGKDVPVAEYNKWDTRVTRPDSATKPYEETKFKGLGNQGLITDHGRGITNSSARRESPSKVFGIITPGPVIDSTASPSNIRRKGGSSFIMDDGTNTEYVQLTTKSGAQIRLDETNGFVYLINRDGTAWVQMDQKGNVDVFGATSISMRAQKDINIRADRNINIEAGQNIFMKAAKDTIESTTSFTYDINNIPKPSTIPYWKYVGEGNGEGGNIVTQALNNTHTTVKNNSYITVGNNLELKVTGTIDISADGEYNLTSPSIKNVGSVKIRGPLDVTSTVQFGSTLGVNSSLNAGSLSTSGGVSAATGSFSGNVYGHFMGVQPGPGAGITGSAGSAGPSVNIPVPPSVTPAEVKQLVEKANILATWADPVSKFKRNSESLQTTTSVFPTYEPCPEHETFTFKGITGYSPTETEGAKTYQGSGGAGNSSRTQPDTNTDPGANNTKLPPTPSTESVVSKDINMDALKCQLKFHEGIKFISYPDLVLPGGICGGVAHLMRTNEKPNFPIGTPITLDQVNSWLDQDCIIAISGAQRLLGIDVWGDLTDTRKRACADLCYNLGEGGLSKFVRFIAAMKAGNYNLAGQSLRDSKWFTQVGRRGPNIIMMIVQDVDPTGCGIKFPP